MQLRLTDMDILGHLNNARYLEILDAAKYEYFQAIKHYNRMLPFPLLMIANVNIDFLAQTVVDERVEVRTQVDHIGNKSFVFVQELVNSDNGEVKCRCATTMVYLDSQERIPVRIPDEWRKVIAQHEQRPM